MNLKDHVHKMDILSDRSTLKTFEPNGHIYKLALGKKIKSILKQLRDKNVITSHQYNYMFSSNTCPGIMKSTNLPRAILYVLYWLLITPQPRNFAKF